jgi:hypothetical protein
MPLAMLIKLIPVPDAPFITYLTPWREHNRNVAYRNGSKSRDFPYFRFVEYIYIFVTILCYESQNTK